MTGIPRLLHFVWVGKPMPDHLRKNINRWHDMHPKWVINVWGDEDLTWLQNQSYFDEAERYVPADAVGQFKADIARYEILHRFGGFYADCDTYPLRPIDEALQGRTEFAAAEDRNWVGNTYLGAIPERPVFLNLILALPTSIGCRVGVRPCISTGPQFLTPIWHGARCYVAPTEQWYPYSYKDVRTGRIPEIGDGPYAVHEWQHSKDLSKVRLRERRNR